ncbi:cupin domain-containing protein [Nocardiopsis coralliicola]
MPNRTTAPARPAPHSASRPDGRARAAAERTADPAPGGAGAVAAAPPDAVSGPAPAPSDLDGFGDIVDAGRASPFADRFGPGMPVTTGRLATAAAEAAAVLSRPSLHPCRPGRWQRAPRPARRRAAGRMRVGAVALEPDGFAPLPDAAPGAAVLRVAVGRAHVLTTGPDGGMRSLRPLTPGRTLVLAAGTGHWIVNTGGTPAVAVLVDTDPAYRRTRPRAAAAS